MDLVLLGKFIKHGAHYRLPGARRALKKRVGVWNQIIPPIDGLPYDDLLPMRK